MGVEIERKFLVRSDRWEDQAVGSTPMRQGYLARGSGVTVRVRVAGDQAWLTIKGPTHGISRSEFEYPIPVADAAQLLDRHAGRCVEKRRFRVPVDGHTWEVDRFEGDNAGLVLAEIELTHPDESFALPDWAGAEVSGDPRYFNAYLAEHPYREWK